MENEYMIGIERMPSQMLIAPRPTHTRPQINGMPTAFHPDIARLYHTP